MRKSDGDRKKVRRILECIFVVIIAVFASLFFLKMRPMAPESSLQSEEALQFLEKQMVDDTHDAFLVDTGGKHGTLVVTVEKKNSSQDLDFLLRFTVWDPKHLELPLQTMEADSSIFHWSEARDANFDGYQDFGYMYAMGNQPEYWHFWIWDESEGQFREEPEFDQISCPEFNEETKTIRGWNRSSAMGTGVKTVHQWIDGKLVCVRRIFIDWDQQNDCFELIVEDRIDNGLAEVYHNTFPPDGGDYLEISMKWHDLDYHGEP